VKLPCPAPRPPAGGRGAGLCRGYIFIYKYISSSVDLACPRPLQLSADSWGGTGTN